MSKAAGFTSESVADVIVDLMTGFVGTRIPWGSDMTNMPARPSAVRLGTLLVLTSAAPALSASLEKPDVFVRRVYAHYRSDGPGLQMARPNGTPFYTAVLLDAVAAAGEGTIDWDPVCDCQIWEKFRFKSVVMTGAQTDTVKARVSFANLGSMHTVTLTLSRTPAGWRIADVSDKGATSVMALLQNAIASPPKP